MQRDREPAKRTTGDEPRPGKADTKLPVTADVGDEGGSYADANVQKETFTGDNPRVDDRVRPARPEDAPPESPGDGTRKYPTE